ncbi:MAG: GNAT family N-acetyltransferase [Isosphaeraceae bacterium]
MMLNDLAITLGFPDALRPQVAALYEAAFGPKLAGAIPDAGRRLKILEEGFDPSHALVATSGTTVLGVAGFKTRAGALTSGIGLRSLRAHLGLPGAIRAIAVLALFERSPGPGQLVMDGIAVSPEARGGGIGTRLLNRLKEFAAEQGYRTIRLDVIDTNPGARRLYERLGFVATRTEDVRYLRWLLGFSAATTLEYAVKPEDRAGSRTSRTATQPGGEAGL